MLSALIVLFRQDFSCSDCIYPNGIAKYIIVDRRLIMCYTVNNIIGKETGGHEIKLP